MSKYSIAIGSSVLLLLLCAISIVASPRHADTLTLSGTTPMPFILHHGDFAEWTGGDFVEIEDRFSDSPTLTTFDRDGKELSRFIFTIPGAGSILIYDNSVAVGKDGSLAIIGTAPSNDSSGATFVALVSPDRRHQKLIRPTSFFPESVTMPSDGTIWVSGHNEKNSTKRGDKQQYQCGRTSLRQEWEPAGVGLSPVKRKARFRQCTPWACPFDSRFLR